MRTLVFLLFLFLFSINTSGQKEEISMEAILKDAGKYVDLIEREYDQEIVRMEFDILFTTKETFRQLTDDFEYGILVFGDYRIKDIDVKVYKYVNEKLVLIKEDNESEANAMIFIKPPFTADYLIEIKAYSFNKGYDRGHYGLIIFHP